MISREFFKAVTGGKESRAEIARYGKMSASTLGQILSGHVRVKQGDEKVIKVGEFLGLKPEECFLNDPYLLGIWKIDNVLNSPLYAPGRNTLPRLLNRSHRREERTRIFRRDPDFLLCRGAAVGLCRDGLVRHVWPEFVKGLDQKFVGFSLANQFPDRVIVVTRGSYSLFVQELNNDTERGAKIFSFGPNDFTRNPVTDGLEIGVVDYVWPDARFRAVVSFKAFDDLKSFNMKSRRM